MIDRDIERELLPLLSTGEEILWAARPHTGIKFRTSDAVMIPFSIVWCGFSIFWMVMAMSMGAPIPFVLFGIPFVLIGLYLVFGRFFADANRRARTIYAFTRERVIIRTGARNMTVESIPVASLTELTLEQKADGSGTIVLRPDISTPGALNYSQNFNSSRGPARYVKQGPRIEMIDNVQSVYNLLLDLQRNRGK